jgi:hypothetical protein
MTTLDAKPVDLKLLQETINEICEREKIHAGWMFSVIMSLPKEAAYKKLPSNIREDIEAIIAAVE